MTHHLLNLLHANKTMKTLLPPTLACLIAITCALSRITSGDETPGHPAGATPVTKVEWGPLNPARGDKGPKAGNLWRDRAASGPSGFLVRFADGFASPPHIHNVTYRGVVISGQVHNDDPKAETMWMPPGSFWTQPAGEVHITSAQGGNVMAYIEIEDGPYLVLPEDESFDRGERPVNLHASNIVWQDASNTTWIDPTAAPDAANGPKIAFLWGNPQGGQRNGSLVKLPAGFEGEIRSQGSSLRAVVIQGHPNHHGPDATDDTTMEPGSYFSSGDAATLRIACDADEPCIIYIRSEGSFEVVSSQSSH